MTDGLRLAEPARGASTGYAMQIRYLYLHSWKKTTKATRDSRHDSRMQKVQPKILRMPRSHIACGSDMISLNTRPTYFTTVLSVLTLHL